MVKGVSRKATDLADKSNHKRIGHIFTTILLLVIFCVGLSLMLYPTFSDWWNKRHQSRAIQSYQSSTSRLDEVRINGLLSEAQAYNTGILKDPDRWKMTKEKLAVYNQMLLVDHTGIMGYVEIPKINCNLPIYHGTNEAVLQTSIGHLAGSSLPVGGESTHAVLSGHRGLPSAKLFTNLDKLVEGDYFTVTVLNQTLTYEVDQIKIVLPEDFSDLQIRNGEDLVTLVTCTPYGINTHRLLVRGHRVKTRSTTTVVADAMQIEQWIVAAVIFFIILLVLILWLLVSGRNGTQKADRRNRN